jgi:hypothetical protein
MWALFLTRSVPRGTVSSIAKRCRWIYQRRTHHVWAGGNPERIYAAIQFGAVARGIEFDWDDENKKHLDAHKVVPAEFEQLLNNDPIDLNFELIDNEERYRSVGLTNGGRLLSVVWTIRNGKVRAITAFPASVSDRKAFLERPK